MTYQCAVQPQAAEKVAAESQASASVEAQARIEALQQQLQVMRGD